MTQATDALPQDEQPTAPASAQPDAPPSAAQDPALQGEGNYTAARRHRKSVEKFVDAGKVQPAADAAEPADAAEAQELRDAEAEGRAHAKR